MQMSEPRSDEQLLAALAWDPDAFADLYARYEDAVLAYFSRRVGTERRSRTSRRRCSPARC